MYALFFTHGCIEWVHEVARHLDSYFMYVYEQKLDSIAEMFTYGYLSAIVIAYPTGIITDKLTAKKVAISKIRKVFTCIGMWGAGATFAFLGHAPNLMWAKCMAGLSIVFITPTYVGFYLTYIDISPNFAGLLFGISSSFSYFMVMWVPAVRVALVADFYDKIGWNRFLYTATLLNYFGGLVYALFASADPKGFNKLTTEKARHEQKIRN